MTTVFFFLSLAVAVAAACGMSARGRATGAAAAVLAAGGVASGFVQGGLWEAAPLSLGCATAVTVLAVGFLLESMKRASSEVVHLAAALCVWFGAAAPVFAAATLLGVLFAKPMESLLCRAVRQWKATEAMLGGTGWLAPIAAKAGVLRTMAPLGLCGVSAVIASAIWR